MLISQIVPRILGNKGEINLAGLCEINIGSNSCENSTCVTLHLEVHQERLGLIPPNRI